MDIFPKTIPIGEEYGTVMVRIDGSDKKWEVTTLRERWKLWRWKKT